MSSPRVLRFGIPSLDEFFSTREPGTHGIEIPDSPQDVAGTTSLCIIGADGAGKSVLAMHMAAYYAADTASIGGSSRKLRANPRPCILYASTDLRHSKAQGIWQNFGLQWPGRRADALHRAFYDDQRWPKRADLFPVDSKFGDLEIELRRHHALQPKGANADSLIALLGGNHREDAAVDFVDLAATTAGDDWSYINRLLALLPPRTKTQAAHLLVIDAVEGLETLVGDFDAYGEHRSRRSRISQVMRAAEGKCHIVFVVEEARQGERHPEEFVTDAVIRMRTERIVAANHTFTRRTLEVEKARGQQTVRGRHAFHIADGKGTFTREQKAADPVSGLTEILVHEMQHDPNPDDPPVVIKRPKKQFAYMAYFEVLHSLSYWNRRILDEKSRIDRVAASKIPASLAGFGIDHLDDMLAKSGATNVKNTDKEGLKFGTVTALVGENDTLKFGLARAFLSQAMMHEDQVALMIGLDDSNYSALDTELADLSGRSIDDVQERLVRRRLVGHYSSSAALFKIISRGIGKAKQKLRKATGIKGWLPKQKCGKIRMVISNLTTMREVFPDVQGDPLFLPTLIEYLEHQGVTALVVAAEPGGPNSGRQSAFCAELRGLVHQHICTWHVPFFGEDRVAIAVIPPIRDNHAAVVRELRRSDQNRDMLEVDPHFEMYTGLHEQTAPQLVPLRTCLIGQGKGFEQYMADIERLLPQVFPGSSVINVARSTWSTEYEMLRAYSYLQGNSRLDHTLVMQIDEFWSGESGKAGRSKLANLQNYMTRYDVAKSYDDPFRLFARTNATQDLLKENVLRHARGVSPKVVAKISSSKAPNIECRTSYFRADSLQGARLKGNHWIREDGDTCDRVPMFWDFGFLMLRKFVWSRARHEKSVVTYRSPKLKNGSFSGHGEPSLLQIEDILGMLTFGSEAILDPANRGRQQTVFARVKAQRSPHFSNLGFLTWREFLQACVKVARTESGIAADQPYAFDVEVLGIETLCCWILEMWASEIEISNTIKGWRAAPKIRNLKFFHKADGSNTPNRGLEDLLIHYGEELFRVYLLLGEVASPKQFGFEHTEFTPRHSHPHAIATRHWYSTACPMIQDRDVKDPLIPAPLPGCYTTRGDWSLAIAHGSRSMQTGYRALDLLCSRRANVARLQNGIGLPVRDFKSSPGKTWTRLFEVNLTEDRKYWNYDQVKSLGVDRADAPRKWLWRSGIRNYHRHERYFPKIVGRGWAAWPEILAQGFSGTSSGVLKDPRNAFEVYDRLLDMGRKETGKSRAYKIFKKVFVDEWLNGVRDSC